MSPHGTARACLISGKRMPFDFFLIFINLRARAEIFLGRCLAIDAVQPMVVVHPAKRLLRKHTGFFVRP